MEITTRRERPGLSMEQHHAHHRVMRIRQESPQLAAICGLICAGILAVVLRSHRPLLFWMVGVLLMLAATASVRGIRQVRDLAVEDFPGAVIQSIVWVAAVSILIGSAWLILTRGGLLPADLSGHPPQ